MSTRIDRKYLFQILKFSPCKISKAYLWLHRQLPFPFLNLPYVAESMGFSKVKPKIGPLERSLKTIRVAPELVGWPDDQAYWQLASLISWPMTQRWHGIQANDLTSQCLVTIWNTFLSQTHTPSRSEVIQKKHQVTKNENIKGLKKDECSWSFVDGQVRCSLVLGNG